jgi:TolB-like protein
MGGGVYAQSNALALDDALSNAADYLKGRLSAGSKVVVLNFSSKTPDLSQYIIEELTAYIVNDGVLTVVDRQNLEAIQKEMAFQMSGEVSDETAQAIGQKLGAQIIVSGSITALGAAYRLRVRAISVESAAIEGMYNVTVAQDSTIAALTGTGYIPPAPLSAPVQPPVSNPKNTAKIPQSHDASSFVSLDIEWVVSTDKDNGGSSEASVRVDREIVEGYEREVLTIQSNLIMKYKYPWFIVSNSNESFVRQLRRGSGIRFKALGDGKPWLIEIHLSNVTDDAYHKFRFTTKKNKMVIIDAPYSKFRQPSNWGKAVRFDKDNIVGLNFMRNDVLDSYGKAEIKIFDVEIY